MRVLIVGGSDARISAGLRARELDPTVEVEVILADSLPNYTICGLPFYISGETADWRDLAHRTQRDLELAGPASAGPPGDISRTGREERHCRRREGKPVRVGYDKLVLATGAEPVRPAIPGLDQEGVHLLHTMEDSFRVQARASTSQGGSALVIGGGYIELKGPNGRPELVEMTETSKGCDLGISPGRADGRRASLWADLG